MNQSLEWIYIVMMYPKWNLFFGQVPNYLSSRVHLGGEEERDCEQGESSITGLATSLITAASCNKLNVEACHMLEFHWALYEVTIVYCQ